MLNDSLERSKQFLVSAIRYRPRRSKGKAADKHVSGCQLEQSFSLSPDELALISTVVDTNPPAISQSTKCPSGSKNTYTILPEILPWKRKKARLSLNRSTWSPLLSSPAPIPGSSGESILAAPTRFGYTSQRTPPEPPLLSSPKPFSTSRKTGHKHHRPASSPRQILLPRGLSNKSPLSPIDTKVLSWLNTLNETHQHSECTTRISLAPPPGPAHLNSIKRKPLPPTFEAIGVMARARLVRRPALRESSNPYLARREEVDNQTITGCQPDRASYHNSDDDLGIAPYNLVPRHTSSDSAGGNKERIYYPNLKPALERHKVQSPEISKSGSRAFAPYPHLRSGRIDKHTATKQTENVRKPTVHPQNLETPQSCEDREVEDALLSGLEVDKWRIELESASLSGEPLPSSDAAKVIFTPGSSETASLLPRYQGTRDDPIILGSDSEDSDVEMFYEASPDPMDEWQAKAAMRDCAVCGDETHIADMPSLPSCIHRSEACIACFAQWIASELAVKGWKGITCPSADCNVALEHHEVQQYATAEVFALYDTFAMRDALGQVPDFRWCRQPGCSSGQIHDEDGYIFTCVACGHKMCTVHEVDWHEGETCEEYTYRVSGQKEKDRKAEEDASIEAINKLSKKCPGKDCAFNIQKNHGCDHMTCSRCRHEFCWVCLADYNEIRKKGNAAHEKDCNYHSSRLA